MMDDDDIYGSILSDPKSNSKSNKYSDQYSETNIQLQHPQSSSFNQGPAKEQIPIAPIPPQASLFISNLTWWTSEDDLRQFLGDLSNRIKELQFLENKPNGKSKGMVIVEFVDVATAEVAKEILEGRGIFGRLCEVSFARNPPVKPYERAVGNYNARGDRPAHRQNYRLDQQYHQNQNQRQGYEILYHSLPHPHHHHHHHHPQQHHQQQQHQNQYQHQDEYGHGSSRYVHREETLGTTDSGHVARGNDNRGYENRHDSRGPSSSRYREAGSRDDRSRSPDRKSSTKSRRY